MEVVSTSNFLSSETEKTTTADSFQAMAMNSYVTLHDLMRGQTGSYKYICKCEAIFFYT